MKPDPNLARTIVSDATAKMRTGDLIDYDYAHALGQLSIAARLGAITFTEHTTALDTLRNARQDAQTALAARLREARRMAA